MGRRYFSPCWRHNSAVTSFGSRGTNFESVHRFGSYLLDLVFPPRCVSCRRHGQWFCDFCAQRVLPAPSRRVCLKCNLELPGDVDGLGSPCPGCKDDLGWVGIAAMHEDPLRKAILALKYDGRVELAPSLGRYLRAVTATAPWPAILRRLDGIVPVPLHKERLQERGFNQSQLLALGLTVGYAALVLDNAIERYQATRSQVGLSPLERAVNVKGKFSADSLLVSGKRLLLVDDVYTTGATMRECASTLRESGADAVFGLALASPYTETV